MFTAQKSGAVNIYDRKKAATRISNESRAAFQCVQNVNDIYKDFGAESINNNFHGLIPLSFAIFQVYPKYFFFANEMLL